MIGQYELERLARRVSELDSRTHGMEGLRDEVSQGRSDLRDANANINELREQLRTAEAKIGALEYALEELKSLVDNNKEV